MATFREILTASDAGLVQIFYKVRPSSETDFIKMINLAAAQTGVNHSQLVCALGFNTNIRDLTDILSVVGFASYKMLMYRRNELFATDIYKYLDIDNIVDIYSVHTEDEEILATLRELIPQRLARLEERVSQGTDPAVAVSYKMEMHAIYSGGIADADFIARRIEMPIGDLRLMIDEIHMVLETEIVPPGNLFFSDYLLPAEKCTLIDRGVVDQAMIENRLSNIEISEDERQLLEDYLE